LVVRALLEPNQIALSLARLFRGADDFLATLRCSHGAQGGAELGALAIAETGDRGDGVKANASVGYGAVLRAEARADRGRVTLPLRRVLASDPGFRFATCHVV
jgi:hypothetical protein